MQKVEIENITLKDFKQLLAEAVQSAATQLREEQKAPSDWEELTLERAAAELNCSIRTLTRKMKTLKIRGSRIGRAITLQRKDLKKIRAASGKQEN